MTPARASDDHHEIVDFSGRGRLNAAAATGQKTFTLFFGTISETLGCCILGLLHQG
jgi:hypothetical protein